MDNAAPCLLDCGWQLLASEKQPMTFEGDPYGKRTLDFVDRLRQLTSYEDICRVITSEMEWYGFSCVTDWSIPGPGSALQERILLNTRPQDYIDHYDKKNLVNRDPVVTELRKTIHPYSWSDLRAGRDLSKAEKAIMDEGREFDARDGFIIPIVTLSGEMGLFSPCGRTPDLSQRARSALEIIGIYSHHALKRALLQNQRDETVFTPLTPREREILQWVAAGKTDEAIGLILSISATTVTTHVENAKKKLDAFGRTYAVVQAIRAGEIAL
jgi:LuxR family quorum sensing-dependent transcriptional regulator